MQERTKQLRKPGSKIMGRGGNPALWVILMSNDDWERLLGIRAYKELWH
jgi:hypothetical protein